MKRLPVGDKASSGTVNRWVDPAFSDLPERSSYVSGRRKDTRSLCSKTEPSGGKRPRKRKGELGGSEHQHSPSSYSLKESSQEDSDVSWVDRYSPRSQADLCVHKKKIEEVANWLTFHASKAGVLLLTGPSGCGKTATIQVLSQQLDFRVVEWTNPTNLEPNFNSQQEWRMNGQFCSSQTAQFQDFLLRANKYNCLKMVDDGGAINRKLILVEDFPNQFHRQPGSLHAILRHFVKTGRCPLVFIVSDSLRGDSSSRVLFPREVQEELHITNISFNPVAPTALMKVLTRIATLEAGKSCRRISVPDQAVLESLCSGSSGDIRSAINSLQFSSLPDTSLEKGLWQMKGRPVKSARKVVSRLTKGKKSQQKKEQAEEQAIGGKDASLFLFRALGKILHNKRENVEGVDVAHGASLPSHLSEHHRDPLLVDPELVVGRSHMSGEFFNLYLHQNYLDFFTEVEDVVRASEYLSDADLLTANWTSRGTMGDYGTSVATRGLLHSNSHQVTVGFRPLNKPSWLLVSKKYRENCLAAQNLFSSFCLSPLSLQTELLPYLDKLSIPMRNQAQIAFIQDVSQLSFRRFPARVKLEVLTDKDPGLLVDDEDDDDAGQGGTADGLPTSQPQPVTNQVQRDEEEMLIEDYISD